MEPSDTGDLGFTVGLSLRPEEAKTAKMAAKRLPVKSAAVSLPVLNYSVAGRVKNSVSLFLTRRIVATDANGAQGISCAPLRCES